MIKLILVLMAIILIGAILSGILSTTLPILIAILTAGILFFVFVPLWNIIGIKIVFYGKRIINRIKNWLKSLLNTKRKRITGIIILVAMIVILVVTIILANVLDGNNKENHGDTNDTTSNENVISLEFINKLVKAGIDPIVSREFLEQLINAGMSLILNEIPKEEETTSNEANNNGNNINNNNNNNSNGGGNKINYNKPAERETTRGDQNEIASSKKAELGISSNGNDVVKETVVTTVNNGVVNPPVVKNEEETTKKIVIEPPTTPEVTEKDNGFIIPILPPGFNDNDVQDPVQVQKPTQTPEQSTQKPTQSTQAPTQVTQKPTQSTQTPTQITQATQKPVEPTQTPTQKPVEQETSTVVTKPKTNITVSYTSGAGVANVLVTFDKDVKPEFKLSFGNVETKEYAVVKNSDASYSIKVNVPSNFLGKLVIRVFDENGMELKQMNKVINNK